MDAILVSGIFLLCVFGGALLGLLIRTKLPDHHLSKESRDAVKLGAGLIATLTAMVLGLLISSAKTSYDTLNSSLTQSGSKMILLDRTLAHYGPETQKIRERLKETVQSNVAMFWPQKNEAMQGLNAFEKKVGLEQVEGLILELIPQRESQRVLQMQAVQLCDEQLRTRWLLVEQAQLSLPSIFVIVLGLWLTVLFICFGLLAPANGTVVAIFFVCALSTAGAMFLIQEMNTPLAGIMKISSAPFTKALEHLGK